MAEIQTINARLATIDQLLQTTVPVFLSPPPSKDTFRNWLDRENVPRFKCNPSAKRGGGTVWYSTAAVEKLLRRTVAK
jgi:hypothetical protein